MRTAPVTVAHAGGNRQLHAASESPGRCGKIGPVFFAACGFARERAADGSMSKPCGVTFSCYEIFGTPNA